ncbi:MAG: hypothetical protein HUU49_00905 [Candidatus Buchananbacteria bacterium]|nr:hypothetical protein [Candidatus Buchananbacteria bacterium]
MQTKQKIIIAVLAVLLLSGMISYFIILPTINDIKKISNDVYLERLDLEKKYLKGQLLKKTMEDFEKIKPEKNKLANIFIKEGKELEFITALESISSQYKLEQTLKLGTKQDQGSGTYHAVPLEIVVKGTFVDTLKYLNELEKLNYYYSISSIALGSAQDQSLNPVVSSLIVGKIYVMPEPEEAKITTNL